MTVVWTRRALSGIAGIYSYIATENAEAAVRVTERLYESGQSLAQLPERGRPGRLTGTRELVIDPYVMTYRIRRDTVRVLSVEHGARRR